LFNAVTNKRQHRSSIDLEHKPLLFRVLSSAQFIPQGPLSLQGQTRCARRYSIPPFSRSLCCHHISRRGKAFERRDAIVERAKDGSRPPFQNLKADPE
jgi:hypothetical protein